MRKRTGFGVFILIILFMMVAGCVGTPTPTATQKNNLTPTPGGDAATQILFQVALTDGTQKPVSVAMLKSLPLGQLFIEGKMEEGPRVLDVLKTVGVMDFKQITFTGPASSQTLTREQVDNETLLDFANRGTVKLATKAIPKADWVKDINLIQVK